MIIFCFLKKSFLWYLRDRNRSYVLTKQTKKAQTAIYHLLMRNDFSFRKNTFEVIIDIAMINSLLRSHWCYIDVLFLNTFSSYLNLGLHKWKMKLYTFYRTAVSFWAFHQALGEKQQKLSRNVWRIYRECWLMLLAEVRNINCFGSTSNICVTFSGSAQQPCLKLN